MPFDLTIQTRQALVLTALEAVPLDRIQIMKTLFLVWFRRGAKHDAPFVFKAYNYGPFSKAVYDTLDDLLSNGIVAQADTSDPQSAQYYVTRYGKSILGSVVNLESSVSQEVQQTASWASEQTFNELLRAVYQEAPEFAKNSLVKDAILNK